jgi:uncharacterized MAPEG superfamily protein
MNYIIYTIIGIAILATGYVIMQPRMQKDKFKKQNPSKRLRTVVEFNSRMHTGNAELLESQHIAPDHYRLAFRQGTESFTIDATPYQFKPKHPIQAMIGTDPPIWVYQEEQYEEEKRQHIPTTPGQDRGGQLTESERIRARNIRQQYGQWNPRDIARDADHSRRRANRAESNIQEENEKLIRHITTVKQRTEQPQYGQ